ncbi:MAG TPA: AAA family ATPase [Pusillimonas sp.]|uniref:ParA family protein n=1 Tax=Pusillimonas sp. TaxID=3040095 RepID=UPI002C5C310F|nr:AAA family ATPase [Pusillimonas sp.]HUH87101.1 AAA family ATPase [Pusillimonas sp.]
MKIIACYSNKGGVGKTATCVNLAYSLAATGNRTLLCDLDPQGASSFYFRVKPSKKLDEAAFFKDVEKFAKAIRGSDYDNLDILPANMNFREFDVFLSQMRNSQSRLKKTLKAVQKDYDYILLDCPPSISTLSENIFRASDVILIPVIPTTLSQRTFEQLIDFFKDHNLPEKKLLGFFSMAQGVKNLHSETIGAMQAAYKGRFLKTRIPFASSVERMGIERAPVVATAPGSVAGRAYQELADELIKHLG